MTLTKYKNESHEDSKWSQQAVRQADLHGRGNETVKEVKKSDFDRISTGLRRANFLAEGECLEMSDDGFVFMSASLLNKSGLEVRIDGSLKEFVKASPDGKTLIFPANIDWRFLEAKRTNGTKAVLNIGGNKSQGMELLTPVNVKEYLGEKDYLEEQQKNQISSALEAIKANNPELADLKVSFEDGKIVFLKGEEQV